MARMPTPGGDDGQWGDILNEFLSQSHTLSGALKADSVDTAQLRDGAVSKSKTSTAVQTSLDAADNAVPSSQKGAANGVATLDGNTRLPDSQLPNNVATKSTNSADTGKAIDAYTGAPLAVATAVQSDGETPIIGKRIKVVLTADGTDIEDILVEDA